MQMNPLVSFLGHACVLTNLFTLHGSSWAKPHPPPPSPLTQLGSMSCFMQSGVTGDL